MKRCCLIALALLLVLQTCLLCACEMRERINWDAFDMNQREKAMMEDSAERIRGEVDLFRVYTAHTIYTGEEGQEPDYSKFISGLDWLESGAYTFTRTSLGGPKLWYPYVHYCAVYPQEEKPTFARGEGEYAVALFGVGKTGEDAGKLVQRDPIWEWGEILPRFYPYIKDPSLVIADAAGVQSVAVIGYIGYMCMVRYTRWGVDWYLCWEPYFDQLYLLRLDDIHRYQECLFAEDKKATLAWQENGAHCGTTPDYTQAHEKARALIAHRLFAGPIDPEPEDTTWFLETVLPTVLILTGTAALSGFALAGYRRRKPCKEIEE